MGIFNFKFSVDSPHKYTYPNNLLISPIIDNKSRILITPKKNYSPDIGHATPHNIYDIKYSPYLLNQGKEALTLDILRHDDKSSSFKRIQFHSNFPPDYYPRMINFEGNGQFEEKRKIIFRNKDLFSETSSEEEDSDAEEEEEDDSVTESGKNLINF